MRVVRGREDARFFPSRHNFALFRLYAYFRLRAAPPEIANVLLVVDRNQSAKETWVVACWVTAVTTAYTATVLLDWWPLAAVLVVSFPVALLVIQIPIYLSGLGVVPALRALTARPVDPLRVNSVVMMALLAAASVYFATRPGWSRIVGWQVLLMLVLNGAAAVVVFLLRNSISRLEKAVGGEPSER